MSVRVTHDAPEHERAFLVHLPAPQELRYRREHFAISVLANYIQTLPYQQVVAQVGSPIRL